MLWFCTTFKVLNEQRNLFDGDLQSSIILGVRVSHNEILQLLAFPR